MRLFVSLGCGLLIALFFVYLHSISVNVAKIEESVRRYIRKKEVK